MPCASEHSPIYVNMGCVRISAHDCWIVLARQAPGEPPVPVVTLVLPLQAASGLCEEMSAALAAYVYESNATRGMDTQAVRFEPMILPQDDGDGDVIDTAKRPCEILELYGARILRWRTEGLSVRRIAQRLHISASTVWDFLRYKQPRGSQCRGSQLDAKASEIWHMRRERWGYKRIAQACGVTKSTIYTWLQKHPVPHVATGTEARYP